MHSRISVLLLILVCGVACAPTASASPWDDLQNTVQHTLQPKQSSDHLKQGEIVSGLKEALGRGTTDAIDTLGRKNGFWDNAAVRIPLPKTLQSVAGVARKVGMGDKVDAFQLSLNRAAEKAVPRVADIFGKAIRKMSFSDARDILTGGDHAATQYFRRVAGPELVKRIEPIVARETNQVGVSEKYKQFMASGQGSRLGGLLSRFGGDSGAGSSLDLDDYVTQQTINGLFHEIGQEEAAIREDPAARTTDLLKKVFGGH
jgi:hypothetical protein